MKRYSISHIIRKCKKRRKTIKNILYVNLANFISLLTYYASENEGKINIITHTEWNVNWHNDSEGQFGNIYQDYRYEYTSTQQSFLGN